MFGWDWGFPGGSDGEESIRQCRRCRKIPWVRKIPWSRKWQSTAVFLPVKSHGQRSLAGHSPWSCKESDTTEQRSKHKGLYVEFGKKGINNDSMIFSQSNEVVLSTEIRITEGRVVFAGSRALQPSSYWGPGIQEWLKSLGHILQKQFHVHLMRWVGLMLFVSSL